MPSVDVLCFNGSLELCEVAMAAPGVWLSEPGSMGCMEFMRCCLPNPPIWRSGSGEDIVGRLLLSGEVHF